MVSADGAPREILDEAKAGPGSAAEDLDGLVRSIRTLVADPELAAAMGERGRSYAKGSDRRVLVERLESLLERVADDARAKR